MSPVFHSRFIVCLLFLVSLGLGNLPQDSLAQTGTSLPSLSAATMTAVPGPFVTVAGEGFTHGGLVYIALYDQWGTDLKETRWTTASPETFGANGSLDPAQGYDAGGVVSEGFDLFRETVYGPNGSMDPAQGYAAGNYSPVVVDAFYGLNGSQDPANGYVAAATVQESCSAPLMVRAYDQDQQAWSNTLDVSIGC
jgi:hypothetical protein